MMKINQIRNATMVVEYAGKKFLIDPMLADKGSYPPFPNSERQNMNNPLVDLPTSVENIIEGIDAVILTHLHLDHFDEVAQKVLPKDIKMFVQNEDDAKEVSNVGFRNIEVLQETTSFEGIQLIKTKGEHGRGEILKLAGLVCGVIFKNEDEKTLYVAGDTVWYEEVDKVITKNHPEVIVVNGGDNQFLEGGSLVMGKEDVYKVYEAAPNSKIIVVHMEAVNHWTLSRKELLEFIDEKGIESTVYVPEDGESFSF
jgi:L-ascorbate metabolism protein UlaG (beta-lactamase superfamily)